MTIVAYNANLEVYMGMRLVWMDALGSRWIGVEKFEENSDRVVRSYMYLGYMYLRHERCQGLRWSQWLL